MSIDLKHCGFVHSIHKLNDNQQINTEFTNLSTVKNQLRFNNLKLMDNNNHLFVSVTKNNCINFASSGCVSNLNLSKIHIDKLQLETTSKINNTKKDYKNYKLSLHKEYYETEQHHLECNDFEEPALSEIDIYQIDLIKQLYSNIESNVLDYSEYIIIMIYELIESTHLINKQLATAIPIVKGIPERSITEITTISHSGKLYKNNKTICLHRGRITYTKDWLTFENVERINNNNTLFKFIVNYRGSILNGFAFTELNKSSKDDLKLSNCTLYISDFSNVWK
ncbi:hypothetical protein [Candidatus Thiodiazotropha endoloripes]|uniref:hypothetical protein n=1 Tax=Candidatus Thiodiazotropha endoloripes TaxID=1818881 RepID=UPI001112ABB9|nr:hypothetical protein [Candidatus Thiodiazotropha endoloripes]